MVKLIKNVIITVILKKTNRFRLENYQTLSNKYRYKNYFKLNESELRAYVKARMPATRAAITQVFVKLKEVLSSQIKNLLDLGAGPGTGFLVAAELFPTLEKVILVEQEEKMIELGKKQINDKRVEWCHGDMRSIVLQQADMALFGYSFGELDAVECLSVLEKVWKSCALVVIVEPGTPRGFERIKLARQWFIDHGGYILAPCPHQNKCPMTMNDWCHFSVRLERSKEHRQLKDGTLGWEDEKFSYLIASHKDVVKPAARIIRHPIKKTGHVLLKLCTEGGLMQKTLSKKQKDLYRTARNMEWGDSLSAEQIVEKAKHSSQNETVNKSPESTDNSTNESRSITDIH